MSRYTKREREAIERALAEIQADIDRATATLDNIRARFGILPEPLQFRSRPGDFDDDDMDSRIS